MTALALVDIGKSFGKELVLEDVSFDVSPGEIVALVGSSGAGKSTVLKIAAGIEKPTSGSVLLGGQDVSRQRSWKRQMAMVFESYVLYPLLTVRENIAFPLRAPAVRERYSDADVDARIQEIARICQIDDLLERRPLELSGGQRQRVALCRALVRDPAAYLMDEPIAHLDAKLRHWLRGELRRLLTAREVPTIWVTPDGVESMAIADRIAVLVDHKIVQLGTPREIYGSPATIGVARLLGDLGMNILDARTEEGGGLVLDGAEHAPLFVSNGTARLPAGPAKVGIRPAELRLRSEPGPAAIAAEVIGTESGSRQSVVIVRVGAEQSTKVVAEKGELPQVGQRVYIDWEHAPVHVFSPEGGRHSTGRVHGGSNAAG
jgi:multiple sugar transport system ATP-binding protein